MFIDQEIPASQTLYAQPKTTDALATLWRHFHTFQSASLKKGGRFKKFQLVKKQYHILELISVSNTAVLLALATASRVWYSRPLKHQRLGTLRGPWRQLLFFFFITSGADAVWLSTVPICQPHRCNVFLKSAIWTCCWGKCDVRRLPA